MTPKEYKQMMDYLTRSGIRDQVKFASDIARPDPKPEIKEIEAINAFMKRNPKVDGGRIGFADGIEPKVEKFKELVKKGNSITEAKNKVIDLYKLKRSKTAGTPVWMDIGKKQLIKEGILEDKERGNIKFIGETEDFSKDKNIKLLSKKTIEPGIKEAKYQNKTTGKTFVKYKPLLRSNTVTVSGAGFDTLEQAQQTVKDYNEANPKKTAVTLKLEEDLRKLANSKKLAPLLKTGTPDKKYLKVVQEILDLNVSQAEDKLKQLGEAVRPNSDFDIPGINKISEKKATNISNFYKSKSVSKKVVDTAIGKSVGEKSLKNLRAEVQGQLPFPGGPKTFETDEAKAKMGSFRLGSNPYSIFGQVIDGRLNQGDKMRYDSLLSRLEEDVQKALKGELIRDGKKITPIEAVNKYNAAATEAENLFNSQKMRNFKPVRIPKISLESPNKTIANKTAYTKYKQFFDKNYKELGYSFKIPKDLKPIPEIAADLKDKNSSTYKNMIRNVKEIGKKFIKNINEYDEQDLLKIFNDPKFQKFKRLMPRLVSNDDFSERLYASANNIMSDATYVGGGGGGGGGEEEQTFAEKNPITTGAGLTTAGTAAVLKATGTPIKTALGKAFRGAGTPIAGPIYAGMNIVDKIKSGSSVADAVIDPMTGLELSFPGLFKENLKKITSNPTAQKILSLGRFGRALTPIGAGITAAGLAKDYSEFVQRELERKAADPEAYRAEQQEQMGMSAADGGRAGFKVGSLRKGIQALIDESVKKTPKDTTPELDKLIKKTLDEDFFDKKDRIIDTLNAKIAKERKKFPYNQQVQEEPSQLEFYDDIIKSNFRTKTGEYFDRIRRRNKAGGGLLKQAGDRSGPPPESGPNSQGLPGLLKRGMKI